MSGGAVIAAAAAAARREAIARVLDAFRVAGATAPDRGRSLESLGLVSAGPLEVLQTTGVLKAGTTPDGWYLDEAAYVAQRDGTAPGRSRRKMIMLVVIAVLVAVLLVAVAVMTRGGAGVGPA